MLFWEPCQCLRPWWLSPRQPPVPWSTSGWRVPSFSTNSVLPLHVLVIFTIPTGSLSPIPRKNDRRRKVCHLSKLFKIVANHTKCAPDTISLPLYPIEHVLLYYISREVLLHFMCNCLLCLNEFSKPYPENDRRGMFSHSHPFKIVSTLANHIKSLQTIVNKTGICTTNWPFRAWR